MQIGPSRASIGEPRRPLRDTAHVASGLKDLLDLIPVGHTPPSATRHHQ
jgi:hypothetical protein